MYMYVQELVCMHCTELWVQVVLSTPVELYLYTIGGSRNFVSNFIKLSYHFKVTVTSTDVYGSDKANALMLHFCLS